MVWGLGRLARGAPADRLARTESGQMRILAIDAALARCSAGVVRGDSLLASRVADARQGHAALLPGLVEAALAEAELAVPELDLIAVTVGPGSFTGVRAALSLAHGLALGGGVPIVGVTVGEALADALPRLGGRTPWVATDSRRGRIFLERGPEILSLALDALPAAGGPVAVAGDASIAVAGRLAARDANVMLTNARFPAPRHVAMVAAARHEGRLPARGALPMYVDPPEARLPAGGLRPPPV